jgi:hypothetical protein
MNIYSNGNVNKGKNYWPRASFFFLPPFFFLVVVGDEIGDCTGPGFGGIAEVEASAETSLPAKEDSLVLRRESILLSKQIFACNALI